MEDKLAEVEKLRDNYFLENPGSSSAQRNRAVKENCLRLLEEVTVPGEQISKAKYHLLCGKILNVCPEWDGQCEEHLSKAVKLDPTSVESWNELGECLWKKADAPGAQNCFNTANQKTKNSVSLRNLAMILRQEQADGPEKKRELIKKSLDLAKEATELGENQGENWYSLGNAYLAYFFACGQQNSSFIEKALEAYEKAMKLGLGESSADLHFNFAQALLYEQRYSTALDSLIESCRLDPEFDQAKEKLHNVKTFLRNCQENVIKKKSALGPYAGGSVTGSNGTKVALTDTALADLRAGCNPNKVVVGRVVGFVPNEETIPQTVKKNFFSTFIMVDRASNCCAVTVYNFSPRFGLVIGNSVAIPEPFVIQLDFQSENETFRFQVLRVPSPSIMIVNGKKLGKDQSAMTEVSMTSH